jgi:GNAT superfamily N-acetyltransferase
LLTIRAEDPGLPDTAALLDELSAALAAITGDSGRSSFDPDGMHMAGALFAVARDDEGRPVGCGALRPLGPGVAELKRMFAKERGVGGAVLAFLEAEAAAMGYRAVWLSTRSINARAIRFYLSHGYAPVPQYGKYAGNAASVCLGKDLS